MKSFSIMTNAVDPVRHPSELALYIHIPFCERKCHYCDFTSGPVSAASRQTYLRALKQEIFSSPWRGSSARTVFFGGGTPSELSISEMLELVRTLGDHFTIHRDAEWTLECNPGTATDSSYFVRLLEMGFNRISIGVQSFHDNHLRSLGRIHDAAQARQTYDWIREAGFDNVNIDLLFSLPEQTLAEWKSDLIEVFRLDPEHLSLYGLSIEPGTEFGHRHRRGELSEVDEHRSADMYELTMEMTAQTGYTQYEISNYARLDRKCLHNLIYWRNEPYLGFGVSAASYLNGLRWRNTENLAAYMDPVSSPIQLSSKELLSPREALGEEIMLRLQMEEGISISKLSFRYSLDVASLFSETLTSLRFHGLVTGGLDQVRLTERGKLLANEVCLQFL